MASSLLYALYYLDHWRMPPVFIDAKRRPVASWAEFTDTLPSRDDVINMYRGIGNRKHIGVAVATGPYQSNEAEKSAVIDVDAIDLSQEEKVKVMVSLAKEGFVVVDTPRGFHLHFKTRDNAYGLSLTFGRSHVGEGAILLRHLWTSPPSVRPAGQGFHVYRFVLPDGTMTAKYSAKILEKIELSTMSLDEAGMILDAMLGVELKGYRPSEAARREVKDAAPIDAWDPIFYDMDEFHAKITNFPLPVPIARILYNYYISIGADTLAADIAAKLPGVELSPIPHGARFLAAAEYTLFVSHLVARATWEELLEPLMYGVEDWPDDEGVTLDKKLSYLVLFSDDGYVMPRYSGLGSLRPVMLCDGCPWRYMCDNRGAKPWRHVARMYRLMYG